MMDRGRILPKGLLFRFVTVGPVALGWSPAVPDTLRFFFNLPVLDLLLNNVYNFDFPVSFPQSPFPRLKPLPPRPVVPSTLHSILNVFRPSPHKLFIRPPFQTNLFCWSSLPHPKLHRALSRPRDQSLSDGQQKPPERVGDEGDESFLDSQGSLDNTSLRSLRHGGSGQSFDVREVRPTYNRFPGVQG